MTEIMDLDFIECPTCGGIYFMFNYYLKRLRCSECNTVIYITYTNVFTCPYCKKLIKINDACKNTLNIAHCKKCKTDFYVFIL